jgi:hypothetical protein
MNCYCSLWLNRAGRLPQRVLQTGVRLRLARSQQRARGMQAASLVEWRHHALWPWCCCLAPASASLKQVGSVQRYPPLIAGRAVCMRCRVLVNPTHECLRSKPVSSA